MMVPVPAVRPDRVGAERLLVVSPVFSRRMPRVWVVLNGL